MSHYCQENQKENNLLQLSHQLFHSKNKQQLLQLVFNVFGIQALFLNFLKVRSDKNLKNETHQF